MDRQQAAWWNVRQGGLLDFRVWDTRFAHCWIYFWEIRVETGCGLLFVLFLIFFIQLPLINFLLLLAFTLDMRNSHIFLFFRGKILLHSLHQLLIKFLQYSIANKIPICSLILKNSQISFDILNFDYQILLFLFFFFILLPSHWLNFIIEGKIKIYNAVPVILHLGTIYVFLWVIV